MKTNEKELDAFEIFQDIEKNKIKFAEIQVNDLEAQYAAIAGTFGKNNIPQKLWEELQLAKNRLEMLRKEAEREAALKAAISQLADECHFKPASKNNLFSTDKVECRSNRMELVGVKIDISQIPGTIDICFTNGSIDTFIFRFNPDKREIFFDISLTKDWQISLETKFREISMNFMEQAEILYMIRLIRETLVCHGYKTCDKYGF